MNADRNTSRRLMAWSLTGLGLFLSSGCGLSSAMQRYPDHVFSTTPPQMLEQQSDSQPLPARAHYPDDQSWSSLETSPAAADGVVRRGVFSA